MKTCPARACRGRAALTLVELVISMVLISVMLAAAMSTVAAAKMGQRTYSNAIVARQLAEHLMAEILQQPYADPSDPAPRFGVEDDEDHVTRADFDDVDDYDQWVGSPPESRDGTPLPGLGLWERSVEVGWVNVGSIATRQGSETGIKRITVTVSYQGAAITTLVAVRAIDPPATQACCLDDGSTVDLPPDDCVALGGTPLGTGTSSFTDSCATEAIPVTTNSASSAATAGRARNLWWMHTVNSGNDRLLLVGISLVGGTSTTVFYGDFEMTLVGRYAGTHTVEIWQLVSPPIGSHEVYARFSTRAEVIAGATAFNDVDLSDPTGPFASGGDGESGTASVTLAADPNGMVLDVLFADVNLTATAGDGQTAQWHGTNGRTGAGSTEAGAESVTMSWELSEEEEWTIGAVAVNPASGGG